MSFYQSKSGLKIDGSAENSFQQPIKLIPDGTQAHAAIKSFELYDGDYGKTYRVTWKLLNGTYKNYEVRQNIKCFDTSAEKRDVAVNMLLRLFKIGNYKPSHSNEPQNEDLQPMVSKIMGIKIAEWFKDGKSGN